MSNCFHFIELTLDTDYLDTITKSMLHNTTAWNSSCKTIAHCITSNKATHILKNVSCWYSSSKAAVQDATKEPCNPNTCQAQVITSASIKDMTVHLQVQLLTHFSLSHNSLSDNGATVTLYRQQQGRQNLLLYSLKFTNK